MRKLPISSGMRAVIGNPNYIGKIKLSPALTDSYSVRFAALNVLS